jgi:hypothetical protein
LGRQSAKAVGKAVTLKTSEVSKIIYDADSQTMYVHELPIQARKLTSFHLGIYVVCEHTNSISK